MDYLKLGDTINYNYYNAIVYLLRKFKRLTSNLKINNNIKSDYGEYNLSDGFTSIGDNYILENDVDITSNNVLKNCFYTFIFNVIDVNTTGIVNRRQVNITGNTGNDGVLDITVPMDSIGDNEVILPDFVVDIVFDEHEYYTPVSSLDITLTVDKKYISVGEVATVTATVLGNTGTPVEDLELRFDINGSVVSDVTDSEGVASVEYTGTGVGWVNVTVSGESIRFYDGEVLTAEFSGNSIKLGYATNQWLGTVGDVIIDWGDGTTSKVNNPTTALTHTYTDNQSNHDVSFVGEVTGLGDSCFQYCSNLTSINLPDSIVKIGALCFNTCTGLTAIILPDSIETIGERCFRYCSNLASINIPVNVETLPYACFYNCSSLTEIDIPNGVKTLGESCFGNCSNLETINIPNTVTSIGQTCFQFNSSLESITIPNSVTELGAYCFYSCTNLESAVLSNNISNLNNYTFYNCSSLTSVIIPDGVRTLGDRCFYGCTNLIEYQLYWEYYGIIRYDSNKLPTNLNTTFTIPKDTRIDYRNKSYPADLLEERNGKNIKLSCSTPVIEQYETAVIVATYTDGATPLANQKLMYQITQGGTDIDSGSVTTDSNGKANINVIPSVTGEVKITVKNNEFTPYDIVRGFVLIVTESTHNYDLVLTADKSIIDENDTATVTALLTDNNIPVGDKTLTYTVKHGATVIDSGSDVTDSNGEISISYAGTGAGKVEIVVEYSIILQETYELKDCIAYDSAILNDAHLHNEYWIKQYSNLQAEVTANGTSIIGGGGGQGYLFNKPGTSTSDAYDWDNNICIEFDVYELIGNPYFQIRDASNNNGAYFLSSVGVTDGSHVRIIFTDENTGNFRIIVDGIEKTPKTINNTDLVRMGFVVSTTTGLTFKNFAVYPI